MKRYLIIGNGVAGTTAAEHIRRHDEQGEITILTDEELPFYYRIRLNEYISGDMEKKALLAKKAEWYAERRIKLLTGARVTGAEPEKQYVMTAGNEKYTYDLLLLATGSRSFVPPIRGVEKNGVFTLRTVADADRIMSFGRGRDNVLLIGGGLLGRYAVGFGTDIFVVLAAVIILPAAALFWVGYNNAGEPKPSPDEAGGKKGHLHLSILTENRTVLFIAFIIFAAQVVATALDFRFTQLVQDVMPLKDVRTAYLGTFWMNVNIFSFSMQFLLTPLLLRYIPRRGILTAIPAVHIVTCLLLFVYPTLGLASTAFLLFKGMDYSIFRASKETLYIPFSYDTRYRAKQVADAFTYRFAKGLTATWVSGLKAMGSIAPGFYPALGVLFSAVWLLLSFPLTAKREPAGAPER